MGNKKSVNKKKKREFRGNQHVHVSTLSSKNASPVSSEFQTSTQSNKNLTGFKTGGDINDFYFIINMKALQESHVSFLACNQ